MGATKTDHYDAEFLKMAQLAKAIGHPARIAIIQYLHKTHSCINNDIVDYLPLAQPTVSQHLRELKNAGIIQGSVEGNSICYCLDYATLDKLSDFLQQLISAAGPSEYDRCC